MAPRSLAGPGILLGAGLGGFVDGIVLHQVLQWHHLLSSTDSDRVGIRYYPTDTVHGLRINTLWDGLFHTCIWLMVLVGLAWLFSRVDGSDLRVWRARSLWGWVLVGWGIFNVVEGLVDHHVLAIHHVRAGEHQLVWDLGFLVLGAVLILIGYWWQRGDGRAVPAETRKHVRS